MYYNFDLERPSMLWDGFIYLRYITEHKQGENISFRTCAMITNVSTIYLSATVEVDVKTGAY